MTTACVPSPNPRGFVLKEETVHRMQSDGKNAYCKLLYATLQN